MFVCVCVWLFSCRIVWLIKSRFVAAPSFPFRFLFSLGRDIARPSLDMFVRLSPSRFILYRVSFLFACLLLLFYYPSLLVSTNNPIIPTNTYFNTGYSFSAMVTMPTYRNVPTALPRMSSRSNHSWPGAYRPRSSTRLLSPLVSNWTAPSGFSWTRKILWTMGISRSLILKTTTSPTPTWCTALFKNNISPRWKAGSMLPDKTTTTGDSDFFFARQKKLNTKKKIKKQANPFQSNRTK